MKRILICIATIVLASGAVQASGVIACSGVANSLNSCYTSHLSTFDLQLNWDTVLSTSPTTYNAPPIDGTNYNTTWYGSSGFMNVAVTGSSLIRADDYAYINVGGNWGSYPGHGPYKFTGSFDSAPDTGMTTSGVGIPITNGYGEGLLGSYMGGSFLVSSNIVLSTFGFRIASITNANFDVTLNLFTSTDGTGPAQTLTLTNLSGGGNCSSLSMNPPQPCNNAPLLYVSTTGGIRSFTIATNDATGFYIDAFDTNAVPEPTTLLITGAGLLTLAYFIRRKRSAAARQ